ncbi:zinc finger protein 681-like isoform X1 [Plutella xylostella]|uniref:zinc finger protein 681-like isoform X1 n=1 Tax=Plutella xylostella TaxID=51655 RepID=UPI00203253E2|nr:zinc finger protein 681-like isoform X1 [Plutella xylostella]
MKKVSLSIGFSSTGEQYKMEDDIDIEEHDLLDDPALRSVFPDLVILKREIIDFDVSEETPTRNEIPMRQDYQLGCTLEENSGSPPTVCRAHDTDVKPDVLSTDMDDTSTVENYNLTESEILVSDIKKESENAVSKELPFYRNRIILGKIHVDASDKVANYVINNEEKLKPDSGLAAAINSEAGRSKISKQYCEFEQCLQLKIILTDCYTSLLDNTCYCAQCAVLFPTTEAYSEHNTSTHTETTHSTKASAYVEKCKKLVHKGAFECDTCNKRFNSLSKLNLHRLIHTGEKPFECATCQKTFRQLGHLTRHQLIHSGQNPCVCTICKKTFRDPFTLKMHNLIHTGDKPYECNTCKKSFRHLSSLRQHELMHTGDFPFKCKYCQKRFKRKYRLTQHELIHTGEEPFECEICKKIFTDLYYFKRHKLIHSAEKPFECDICKKTFDRKSSLKSHKLVHTGEKPFECDTCKKTFNHRSSLNWHMSIHIGEKPFECDICKKTFYRQRDLKVHKLIHTGDIKI